MTGRLVRIAGPTVAIEGLEAAALNEIVYVGDEHLLAEVIRIEGGIATAQVYEETAGLALGEPAEATGEPLAVELGPGLLGEVFDGVQRPLARLARAQGDFVGRGVRLPALDRTRRFVFEPEVVRGAAVRPGDRLGVARDAF